MLWAYLHDLLHEHRISSFHCNICIKLSEQMMKGISIPMPHIADATVTSIQDQNLCSPGLKATVFTMEQPFYIDRLIVACLTSIIPHKLDRSEMHRIIYEELCCEITTQESKEAFICIANRLVLSTTGLCTYREV